MTEVPAGGAVVLDTNALLLPFTDGTDLEGELQRLGVVGTWLLPDPVVQELATLSRGSGRTAQAAAAAWRMVERRGEGMQVVPTASPGDDGVLEVARLHHAVVVSNDRNLHKACRESGLAVVASRGSGRLHVAVHGPGVQV